MVYKIGKPIFYFDELVSTNSYVFEHMDILPDNSVVIAGRQIVGKGRLGRTWVSSNMGNMYLSIFLKGNSAILPYVADLTQFSSIVAAKVLEEYILPLNIKCTIKWPNDVLINGKKIAGILAESKWIGSVLEGIAVGIGMNLNMTEAELMDIDQPATSLNIQLHQEVNKDEFIPRFLSNYFRFLVSFQQSGLKTFEEELQSRIVCVPDKSTANKGVQA